MTNEEAATLLEQWSDEGLSDGFNEAATMGAAALRSPAHGAAEMREALVEVARLTIHRYTGGNIRPGYVMDVCEEVADSYLRARPLPAPEVREAVYCTLCGRETQHEPIPVMPETSTGTTLPAPEVPGDGIERDWFDSSDAVTGAGDK